MKSPANLRDPITRLQAGFGMLPFPQRDLLRGKIFRNGARGKILGQFDEHAVLSTDEDFLQLSVFLNDAMNRKGIQQFVRKGAANRDFRGKFAARRATRSAALAREPAT